MLGAPPAPAAARGAAEAAAPAPGVATAHGSDVSAGRAEPGAGAAPADPDVIVQMFDWPWTAIASECTNVLGPDGYGAVQISPPQEAVVLAADGYPWWQAYQPVAYDLNSRFGTEAQLASMVATCHAAGIKVYADVVLHHMTAEANGGVGDNGTTFPNMYDYPPLYDPSDFSSCQTSITDWDDEYQVWNCQLDGLATLNTGLTYVQDQEAAYLNSLIALGVDGFRWDSAKEMNPASIAAIEALLTKPVFVYQDVEYGAGQPVTPELYEGTGSLLEYRYGWDLYDAFTSGTLASLSDFGPSWNSAGMVPSADAVSFVDDQDTERDGGALYYADGADYVLANVFMLAWDYGTPMVLSDYAFSSYDQGPPSAGGNAVAAPGCGEGTWECEERWPAIVGMVGWHNVAGTAPVANWWSDGGNVIAFSRGSAAWVAINAESAPVTETFSTGLPPGAYCDVISGTAVDEACTGTVVAVNAAGQATVTVPAMGAVGIDVNASSPRPPAPACRTSTTWGAAGTTWRRPPAAATWPTGR
jgi:alpha-amylase